MNDGSLRGKVAVVTGSSRGIGRSIAKRLAHDGVTVMVNYVSDVRAASETVEAITAEGGRAAKMQANIADTDEARRLVTETVKLWGRIDILINNAGGGAMGPVSEVTEADWDYALAVNAKGPFFATQEAAIHMEDGGARFNRTARLWRAGDRRRISTRC